jgi:DNA adenine methylase
MSKIKGVFRYPGSKNKAANEIISYFPQHDLFAEIFGGSAAVIIRKEISKVEIYNDIRNDLVNLFQVLVHNFDEFENKAQFMVNSRSWFYDIKEGKLPNTDSIDKAINTYYTLKFSFAGRRSGWPLSINQNSRPSIDLKFLKKISTRFSQVQITDYDYKKAITKIQDQNKDHKILYYLDPPYPGVRSELYGEKFDNIEFEEFLNEIQDPWILSYPAKLDGWYSVPIKIQYSLVKQEIVTEYLISNIPFKKRSSLERFIK